MKVTIDPCNKYPGQEFDIPPSVGILPYWALSDTSKPAKEVLNDNYQFGLFEIKGGTVDKGGVYRYPEDRPLYPIVQINKEDEMVYFYESAFVSIVNKETGETFTTRMD